ncbi:uncharacterized protein LOC124271821, partial [Haliotis rubra]|uniref:uncharacterized protein LOC124271821 n=1 Tax=Haliotis rubra TaxID=36100 RepID=UPI001EE61005
PRSTSCLSCLPPADYIHRDTRSYITVLVIATHSKEADIDIFFRLDGNVTYDNKTYIDRDALSIRLDRYQTFSLNSSSDMTRTIVNATETIAVYSGTYDVRRGHFSTFEQLLPVKHYGHEYILAIQDPYDRDRSYVSALPYQLQVVTDHSDTSIMFNNGSSISVGEDRVYRKQCGNRETFYFNTTRPVMATLCTFGRNYYTVAFVVVPPVSLYSTLTTLQHLGSVQILTDNNNVDVQQAHDTVSTVFSPPVTWKNVSGTRYKVGTLRGGEFTTVTIHSNSTFAILAYYAAIYNGGYSFWTYSDTETSTPDGSGVKLNTGGSIQAGSSDNATVIVGVICGIVILVLLLALLAKVFCSRKKKMPVTRAGEQGADAPSNSMAIYAVPDRAAGGAAGEGTYTGPGFKVTPSDINIVDNRKREQSTERMIYKGFSLVVLLTILQSSKGEDYLVAVAYRGNYSNIMYTVGETGGLVEIKYPHFAYRTSLAIYPFWYGSHLIGDKMQITSDVENAVIVVSASDEEIDIVVDADGVFVPLPVSALGTKYILPSGLSPISGYRSLLLIATHTKSTTVDIFFRMDRGSIDFTNHRYSDGDVLSLKLNPYQTFRISTPYDLNGTVINSEHSVAVYSGIEYASKYTVYDQLPPVKHYGQEYVVAVDDTKLELQIISEHNHVQVTFSSGATVSTGERRLYNRSLERGESLHFTATRPVLVTLSRADGYSSAFTTVPPVHSYVTHKGVWLYHNNLRVKLKILTDTRATVLIKEVNDGLTWLDMRGSRYKVGTLVPSQSHSLFGHSFTFISSDFPFTVLSFYNGSVYKNCYKVSVDEPVHYTGPTYLMALAKGNHRLDPRILASAWENGGQWQIQDLNSRFRVWSRCFNPYNTDYFYPIVQAYTVILVLVLVRDDAVQIKGNLNYETSFSPLPVTALGTKYIMSSCRTPRYMSVLLIATHSKMADIAIIFRLEGYVAYNGKKYTNGDTLSIRLFGYETLSLNSTSDMTGTIVMSTETIAVYSGTYMYDVFKTFDCY